MRIALLEEDPVLRQVLVAHLSALGHEVLAGSDLAQAADAWRQAGWLPDVLIGEVSLLSALGGEGDSTLLPADVLLVGICDLADRPKFGTRRTALLSKPFSLRQLERTVDGLFAGESGSQERRKSLRVRCGDLVTFLLCNHRTRGPFQGILRDISEGGGGIVSREMSLSDSLSPSGHRLQATVVDGPLESAVLAGRVVHIRPISAGMMLGIAFHRIAPMSAERVRRFVSCFGE